MSIITHSVTTGQLVHLSMKFQVCCLFQISLPCQVEPAFHVWGFTAQFLDALTLPSSHAQHSSNLSNLKLFRQAFVFDGSRVAPYELAGQRVL